MLMAQPLILENCSRDWSRRLVELRLVQLVSKKQVLLLDSGSWAVLRERILRAAQGSARSHFVWLGSRLPRPAIPGLAVK